MAALVFQIWRRLMLDNTVIQALYCPYTSWRFKVRRTFRFDGKGCQVRSVYGDQALKSNQSLEVRCSYR